jgi:hypothetical protein
LTERLRRNINHLRATVTADVSELLHCCHSERAERSRGTPGSDEL